MDLQIKSKSDLKALIQHLEQQGFKGYRVEEDLIRNKMQQLVREANVLSLKIDNSQIIEKLGLNTIDSFEEMELQLKLYFDQFTMEDKIKELIRSLPLVPAEKIVVVNADECPIQFEKYTKTLKKYGITQVPLYNGNQAAWFRVHVLTEDIKRLRIVYDGKEETLTTLLTLVYGAPPAITIKTYENGNAVLSGDLELLRKAYLQHMYRFQTHVLS